VIRRIANRELLFSSVSHPPQPGPQNRPQQRPEGNLAFTQYRSILPQHYRDTMLKLVEKLII
jgi:hypothetical protein